MGIKEIGADAAPTLRRMTPGPIFAGLQSLWRLVVRATDSWSERKVQLSFLLHRMRGGNFHSWYSKTLNDWAANSKRANVDEARKDKFLMESGEDDLALLKEFGLKPEHTLMEYGCGWLRAGNNFINYLEPGHYFGNDPAGERIRIGREIFSIRNIEERNPSFFVNENNDLSWMNGRKVDFIWCHAVLGHIPMADCEDIIKNMPTAMHEGTKFLFTYNPIPDSRDEDPNALVTEDVRNFLQPSAFFRQVCERYGMEFEDHRQAVEKYKTTFGVKEGLGVAYLKRS